MYKQGSCEFIKGFLMLRFIFQVFDCQGCNYCTASSFSRRNNLNQNLNKLLNEIYKAEHTIQR